MTKQQKYHASHPWVRHISWARRRCKSFHPRWYPFYRSKGIQCDLTAAQAKTLWERDSAGLLARPSLDRIDSNGNYTFDNCQFMDFTENSLKWQTERATTTAPAPRGGAAAAFSDQ